MQSKSQLSAHFLLINACVTCQTIKLINCWTNFIPATFCAFKGGRRILNPFAPLGVVHKLRLQEKVGRESKNVNFYMVETVNEGGYVVKKDNILSK